MDLPRKGEFVEEVWDIKKIVVGALVILALVGGVYEIYTLYPLGPAEQSGEPKQKVSGVNQERKAISIPQVTQLQETALQKMEGIKKQVGTLNAAEIASSSPQVQKILKDIQSIEKYPKNQVKEMCQKICSGI